MGAEITGPSSRRIFPTMAKPSAKLAASRRRRRQRQLLVALDRPAAIFRLTVHEASSPEGAIVNELKLRILNKDRMPIGQLERAAQRWARRPISAIASGSSSLLDRAGRARSSRGSALRRIWQSRAATRIRADHTSAPTGWRPAWCARKRGQFVNVSSMDPCPSRVSSGLRGTSRSRRRPLLMRAKPLSSIE